MTYSYNQESVLIKRSGRQYSLKAGLAALATEATEISPSTTIKATHGEERLVQQAREWLSERGNNKWSIVYDNNDDRRLPGMDSSTEYDVRTCFPPQAQGSILITTRSPQLPFAKQLRLKKLEDIE